MRRGLAAAFTTWLALVALQTFGTSASASTRVGALFEDVNSVLERALSPAVAAIPDRRTKTKTGATQAPANDSTGQGKILTPGRSKTTGRTG